MEAEISGELQWFSREDGVQEAGGRGNSKQDLLVVENHSGKQHGHAVPQTVADHAGLIIPHLPLVKGVFGLPLSKIIHADHVFLGSSNPAALRMARGRGMGSARCLVPSQHHRQERLQVLAEAATGEGVEDRGEAAVGEGQALCHLQCIVQMVADLTVPKDM